VFEKQEIWRYDEAPVLYDDILQPHYPFKAPLVREIEAGNYEGRYRIIDAGGKELLYNLGKGITAAWAGNHKALADLSFSPNLKADNWTNPKDVSWGEKGWNVHEKAALGTPMGNMTTNDQYLINPIYETEIMTDVTKKSVMMNLVRHRPMMGPSIFLPAAEH
jgi:hypothetical protein